MPKRRGELFNLIVTHYPGYDNYVIVRSQLQQVLERVEIVDSHQSLILARVDDPYKSVEVIRERIRGETPILRVIPVDSVTDVYVDRVAAKVKELFDAKVPANSSFKVEIDGRLFAMKEGEIVPLHTREAIEIIAGLISNPVDVKNPDFLAYVKTVKLYRVNDFAAVTVCKPSSILRYAAGGRG